MRDSTLTHSTLSGQQPASTHYVAPGMPALDTSGKQTSFYEFWPTWLMYLPVVVQSLVLAVRHRSLTLPLIANPKLPLSGMVGVEKSIVLNQAQHECKQAILPWFIYKRTHADLKIQLAEINAQIDLHEFSLPLVCKPDIGCRGTGVKLVNTLQEIEECLACYPIGAGMLLQTLSTWEPEAGIFYVRHPDQACGQIISLALKYSPYVLGDGSRTLQQLIDNDPRASDLQHLYVKRHAHNLNTVIPLDKPYRLVFSASHSRGAIFRNGEQYITPKLSQRIDQLMQNIPEFYYGRLDIKFRDIDSLEKGDTLEIIEINSASSESLHIWDKNTSIAEAIGSLLYQYRTLFNLGAANRARGFFPPKLSSLLSAWKKERLLTRAYPETD